MSDDARTEARRRIADALRPAYAFAVAESSMVHERAADAVLELCEIVEEWRVEGEDGAGVWVTSARDRGDACRIAAELGGAPVVTVLLSLPLSAVKEA